MTTKAIEYGANKPITISLPDKYWDVLFAMSEMEGISPEELAKRELQFRIKDYLGMELEAIEDHSVYGTLLLKGWIGTLEDK